MIHASARRALTIITALCWTAVAHACSPPAGPPQREAGESEAAYKARIEAIRERDRIAYRRQLMDRQASDWVASSRILLARIEKIRTIDLPYASPAGATSHKVKVRPVRWLKGLTSRRAFWVRHTDMTTCGPYGAGDVIDGQVGETFLMFFGPTGTGPHRIINSVGLSNAEEPRVRAVFGI
jgi:hypothetical protein